MSDDPSKRSHIAAITSTIVGVLGVIATVIGFFPAAILTSVLGESVLAAVSALIAVWAAKYVKSSLEDKEKEIESDD
jgi:hypothetical protein